MSLFCFGSFRSLRARAGSKSSDAGSVVIKSRNVPSRIDRRPVGAIATRSAMAFAGSKSNPRRPPVIDAVLYRIKTGIPWRFKKVTRDSRHQSSPNPCRAYPGPSARNDESRRRGLLSQSQAMQGDRDTLRENREELSRNRSSGMRMAMAQVVALPYPSSSSSSLTASASWR